MNYEAKIQASIRRIQIAAHIAERHGEPMTVCFSGGKDSQVMLDLVQRAGVPLRAVYNVTTIDHPANVNFIRKQYPQVEFVHPPLNFWQLIEKKKMLPTMNRRFCCEKLKEYYGNVVIVTGIRREESTKRAKYPIIMHHSKKREKLMFYPIIDWLEWEVWQYIEDNGLPVNPCYDFGRRAGCMVCPFCLVHDKEGDIHPITPADLNPRGQWIEVLDNNFFANPEWREAVRTLKKTKLPVNLHGVDVRIIDEEQAASLNSLKLKKNIHIAWDLPQIDLTDKLTMMTKLIPAYKITCYVLVGFNSTREQDLHRLRTLKRLGILPFVQPYRDFTTNRQPTAYERDLARWANRAWLFKSMDFEDFQPRKGFRCSTYFIK